MSFLYPEVLYFILPIVLVLFGFLLTQKDAESHFFSDEVMSKLRVNSNGLSIQVRNTLFFLSTLFIVISLSGPVIDNGTIEIKSKSADIMVALDISDSMLGEDVYPNRLKASKQKMIDLLEITSSQRIGVIAFAKNSYLVSPLSFDHSAVRFLVKQLSTDSITEKGTDFLSILNVVDSSIESESKKYLLLFSDGGDKDDFSKEIAFAKENNIVVFIIGMGTKKGSPIKLKDGSFIKQNGAIIISKLNENIAQLATKTGGVYIQGVNATDDIKVMMKEIERISEKKELKSEEIQNFIPLFYYPLGLAIFILLIATSSSPTKKFSKLFSFLFLLAIFISSQDAHAGFLDFLELDDAQKAYNNGEFEKSQQLYGEYAKTTKNAQSYYNEGNALYKQGKFKEAIGSYEKAVFDDDRSRAKKYANIGNSYVKEQSEDSLQKAQDSYEKSLKFNEDKDTRENLEAV
ncbi:MAG: VWA domain-containing protein, partial [Campylobacterota bacterium]|nr:VWA domain-containing protein [Campylobacterota bacterium]